MFERVTKKPTEALSYKNYGSEFWQENPQPLNAVLKTGCRKKLTKPTSSKNEAKKKGCWAAGTQHFRGLEDVVPNFIKGKSGFQVPVIPFFKWGSVRCLICYEILTWWAPKK